MKEGKAIRDTIPNARRVVIKIGSRVLIQRTGRPDLPRMRALVKEIAALRLAGCEVVVVSSGAIGVGMEAMRWKSRPDNLPDLQMAAAVGQTRLMSKYSALFTRERCLIGQVLLTHDDLRHRTRHLNARNTIMNLLRNGIIPIVNENDVVSVDEIKFGDNDHLASLVAMLIDADLMILLSTVDGFRRPIAKGRSRRVPYLEAVTPSALKWAVGKGSAFSTGGMRTKLEAAGSVVDLGGLTVIANGRKTGVIGRIMQGDDEGTLIGTAATRGSVDHRKQWIAFFNRAQGTLWIDEGAREAVERKGRSLLPIGIKGVEGTFELGAVVNVRVKGGPIIARGLTAYSSEDIKKIMGCRTSDILSILGRKDYDEVIHRDHMLVLTLDRNAGAKT